MSEYNHGNAVKFEGVEVPTPEWVLDLLRQEVRPRIYHDGVITRRQCEREEEDENMARIIYKQEGGLVSKEFAEKLARDMERAKSEMELPEWVVERLKEDRLWDDKEEDENMRRIMKGLEYD